MSAADLDPIFFGEYCEGLRCTGSTDLDSKSNRFRVVHIDMDPFPSSFMFLPQFALRLLLPEIGHPLASRSERFAQRTPEHLFRYWSSCGFK